MIKTEVMQVFVVDSQESKHCRGCIYYKLHIDSCPCDENDNLICEQSTPDGFRRIFAQVILEEAEGGNGS